MANKIKFQLEDITFEISEKHVQTQSWSGQPLEKPVINVNQVAAASLIKQYAKKRYPEVTVYTSSDSYSMGNSTNIHVTDEYGEPVDKSIIKDIESFGESFVYGSFNGMEDIYEIKESGRKIGELEGYEFERGVKYLFVTSKPKHASLPDVYRMLNQMTSEDSPYIFGQLDMEGAIAQAKSFGATDASIKKALKMIEKKAK
jgi:hypothetical protein